MKAYRILPRSDEDHEKDMLAIDYLENTMEMFEETGWVEIAGFCKQALDWYVELEEVYARLDDVTEDRDYYRNKCREAGIQ